MGYNGPLIWVISIAMTIESSPEVPPKRCLKVVQIHGSERTCPKGGYLFARANLRNDPKKGSFLGPPKITCPKSALFLLRGEHYLDLFETAPKRSEKKRKNRVFPVISRTGPKVGTYSRG